MDEIDHVIYTLHSTLRNPVRKVDDRNSSFKLASKGWRTFPIYAKVVLRNRTEIDLVNTLYLEYPDGTENVE